MNRILTLALLSSVLIFSACNKKFTLFSGNTNKFNHSNLDYEYISMKSKISLKAPGQNLRFTANIRMKKDSAVWISLSPGFGIEAARALITQDSVFVIDKLHKEYDKRSISHLTQNFDFEFALGMVTGVFLGDLMYPVEKNDDIVKENGQYVVVQNEGDLTFANVIGAKSMKVEEVIIDSDSTDNNLTVKYSEFEEQGTNIYPTKINVEAKFKDKKDRSEKSANITIKHQKVEIDQKKYSFEFNIPSKYKQKRY